jgi:hypothetical protein
MSLASFCVPFQILIPVANYLFAISHCAEPFLAGMATRNDESSIRQNDHRQNPLNFV